ncbi:MAG TPA: tetratricopeptide repeat protein [Acidobacteriota bacterium]
MRSDFWRNYSAVKKDKHYVNHVFFLIGCGIFALSVVAGAAYRLVAGRGDPVLIHFSNLGNAFAARGDTKAAIENYRELLKIRPVYPEIEFNMANTLVAEGNSSEAIQHYQTALRLNPGFVEAHYNLANLLAGENQLDGADEHYRRAISLRPPFVDAHYNRGVLLVKEGRFPEAVAEFEEALRLKPDHIEAHLSQGLVFSQARRYGEAIRVLREGLRLSPNHANMADALAWALATAPQSELRNGGEAVRLAEQACAASGRKNPQHLDTLAAAYAETGRFEEAATTAESARSVAVTSGNPNLTNAIAARLSLYRSRQPYRDR